MAAVGETMATGKPLGGTDEASIDNKGRLLLGKKKRERLGATFTMVIGELGCICIYPEDRWQQQIQQIEAADPMNPGRRVFSRLFFGTSEDDLSCDAQGRVVIPGNLRDQVTLGEKVLLIGCYDHIEIWDPAEYKTYKGNPDKYHAEEHKIYLDAYYAMTSKPQ